MKIGVVADDLTGANGTGVKLAKQGLRVVTHFHTSRITEAKQDNIAVCIDTDSRYISQERARERVVGTIKELQRWGADIICKRIDSTFRGNIGQEVDALLESIESGAVGILVPSYPASQRVLTGGYLFVNGVPLQETDVANDPVQPLKHSFLPHILSEQTKHAIELIEIDTISHGSDGIEQEIAKRINAGARLIICDAVTEEHIQMIASAMRKIKANRLVPIDPGPLTDYYIQETRERQEPVRSPKMLVSVGSVTSVTKQQLDYLTSELQMQPVYVKPDRLATYSATWEQEIIRATDEAIRVLEDHSLIVITTNHPDHCLVDFKVIAKQEGVSEDKLAKRITSGLAEISKRLLRQANGQIGGCFFSGGDVTASFCERAEAEGIVLLDEVMPLAAYGEIMGGEFDGLSLVTKGGLVGDKRAIYDSVQFLRKKIHNNRRVLVD
ncbi:four-carbon acid sugar kinase family protein [Thalassobacillus sp. CUG 92003]|uniref:four-carbon acid sugar kinase family protein n=1 Tax=Thalassobacillus sp. CUG 92003 TaxID=2736641 RepID=UPI0015E7E089|nr:four-carbon acid sugar kinase family protein [Thalassobacillus sp. CUG 92003]